MMQSKRILQALRKEKTMSEFESWLHDELEADGMLDEFNAWLEAHDDEIIRQSVDVTTSITTKKR